MQTISSSFRRMLDVEICDIEDVLVMSRNTGVYCFSVNNSTENRNLIIAGFLAAMKTFFRTELMDEADHLQSKNYLMVYNHLKDLTFVVIAKVSCEISEYQTILTMLRGFLKDFSTCFYSKCEKQIEEWLDCCRIDIFYFEPEYLKLKDKFKREIKIATSNLFNFEENLCLNGVDDIVKNNKE